jgi:hypothetical protein
VDDVGCWGLREIKINAFQVGCFYIGDTDEMICAQIKGLIMKNLICDPRLLLWLEVCIVYSI